MKNRLRSKKTGLLPLSALLAFCATCPSVVLAAGVARYEAERPGTPGFAVVKGLQPLSLARGDWDGDGIPDLVAGFGGAKGGRLLFFHGNPDVIYPHAPEAQERRRAGKALDTPFGPAAHSIAVPNRPEKLAVGDFDADGRLDLVAGTLGGHSLTWLRGTGNGTFARPRVIALPGALTALETGEVNRPDGLTDLLAGVAGPSGAELLLFDAPAGAFNGRPESFPLPAAARSLAAGQFDESFPRDVAVLAGGDLLVLPGWDRDPAAQRSPRAAFRRLPAPADAVAIATGLSSESVKVDDLAVVTRGGEVKVLAWSHDEAAWIARDTAAALAPAAALDLTVAATGTPSGRGLVALDRAAGRPALLSSELEDGRPERVAAALSAQALPVLPGSPAVALRAMRLDADGVDDLVVLHRDGTLGVIHGKSAMTYVVNSANDVNDGVCNATHCSLREAINAANANTGSDTINFNISGAGVKTITPASALPIVTDTVTIDATTQSGYSGSPLIEISGASVTGAVSGLQINASSCVVRGFAINRFANAAGVYLYSPSTSRSGNIVESNRLGTNPAGTSALGNGDGAAIAGLVGSSLIGGSAFSAINLLSGNVADGASSFSSSSGNTIQNNYIGTQASANGNLGNGFDGVLAYGPLAITGNIIGNNQQYGIDIGSGSSVVSGNVIGGDAMVGGANTQEGVHVGTSNNTIGSSVSTENQMLNNGGAGVQLSGSPTGNLIRWNAIEGNGDLGIALQFGGVTLNDTGDGDTGSNNLQNFPVVTVAHATSATVTLNSTANTTFTIDIYHESTCDPSGYGEGYNRVGGGTLTTNASGNGSATFTLLNNPGGYHTATATGPGNNTSEFSACKALTP